MIGILWFLVEFLILCFVGYVVYWVIMQILAMMEAPANAIKIAKMIFMLLALIFLISFLLGALPLPYMPPWHR